MSWTLYPAIDVRAGCVVRLAQGDYGIQTLYQGSPLALAQRYAASGAEWLHLVDLDAARFGSYSLCELIKQIKTSTGLRIQTGGGVRVEPDVERILQAGADRVVIGTLAVREPERVAGLLQHFGSSRVTLALDTRQDDQGSWRLPVQGWTEDSPRTLQDLLEMYRASDLRHLLCTDISRDGMLTGFNVALYETLQAQWPTLAVQASGGAAGLDELRTLRNGGVAGAVLGRALLEGRFTLQEALAC